MMKSAILGLAALTLPTLATAQQQPTQPGWPQPMNNNPMLAHAILNQNEWRTGNGDSTYRWSGEGWYGGNLNRAWFKSEGNLNTQSGTLEEAEVQGLYSHAISRYFDLQAGARYNFGAPPSQGWAVLGVQGLAPYFFELGAYAFVSGNGNVSARIETSYDMLITQRLVLQPQIEVNFYTKSDPAREIGSGLADIDTGLRLRYEITRKFAPYIGVTYSGKFGNTASIARTSGNKTHKLQFTLGIRAWF